MITCTECREPVLSEALNVVVHENRRAYSLRTRCCDALLMVGPISDLDPLYEPTTADLESRARELEAVPSRKERD